MGILTTYRIMDGLSGRPGIGSSGTQPPAAGTTLAGSYRVGLCFQTTQGGLFFQGYQWYVPAANGNTAAATFALWQVTGTSGVGTIVPGSTVTSGTLTAGQFNFVPVTTPLQLAPGMFYEAVIGQTSTAGIPITTGQFGLGNPYAGGITNGPVRAFSSATGTLPALAAGQSGAAWNFQQPFDHGVTADPTVGFPNGNDADDLLWLDIQVTDQAPAGSSYRFMPNAPGGFSGGINQGAFTLGLEFSVSQRCALSKIWHYSPSGSVALPTRCGLWNVGSQTVVPGSDNQAPTWSGAAASGWISCDYSGAGVVLAPNTNYKVSTFLAATTSNWFAALNNLFGAGNFYQNGVTAGPLSILNNATATPGQSSWHPTTTWGYPDTSTAPEYDGVDVELLPLAGGAYQIVPQLVGAGVILCARSR